MIFPIRLQLACYLTPVALAISASAQTTAVRSGPEDRVELSPFEVSAESNRGYIASESMTGSRVATQIKDLPFTVNVLTSEFFDDFALFELNDNVAYVGSFTGLDQGGGFNLRGFNATNQLRDGFYRLGRYGSSNVDRIEFIKGPNAAIYGQTSPGGMINMISKKPKKVASQKATVSFGDYDTFRGTFEATGPLGDLWGKNYYITTLGTYNRSYETPMAELTNSEAYVALQHQFNDRSVLLVQFEYFLREVESPTSAAPFILDDKNTTATTDDQIVGIAKNLGTVQQYGPQSELNRGMSFLTGTYEKTFNSTFSSRISSNYYRARRWDMYQNQTAANVNQRTLLMQRGTGAPNKGIIFEDGGGVQADVLAHYWLGDHAIENRTLLTFDYNVYYRYDPNWSVTGAALTQWNSFRTLTATPDLSGIATPIQYLTAPFDWTSQTLGRKNKNRTTDVGTLLRHQMALFKGRMLVFGGARFDKVTYNLRDLAAARQNQFSFDQVVPNLGANFALTPHIRAYANYSESFFPNAQFITAASITPGYKSETAQGFDFGFKGSYFDDRMNFTASVFMIDRQNVVVQELDLTTGTLVNRPEGNQEVQGYELDLNWRITDDLTFGGSFGYVDSKITDFGTKTLSVGRSAARVSPQNGGVYVKYSVRSGLLKGWSGNIGVTYQAETPVSAPDAGDTYSTTGVFQRTTNEWNQRVPAYTLVNLGLRYAFTTQGGSRLRHLVGANVNNLADKLYLTPNRQVGDRQSVFFSYTLSH